MKNKHAILLTLFTTLILTGCAGKSAQPPTSGDQSAGQASTSAYHDNIYLVKSDAVKGSYLTDFAGMTLYTFDKDKSGVSTCDATCARTWKPYSSGATAQKQFPDHITVIKRADGSDQFTWDGKPLYYFASDQNAGDLKGDGVYGVWHVVKIK